MDRTAKKTNNREKEGVITALIGLLLNLALGSAKLVFGIFTGSVSLMSDAVNNLSDVGTSAVTVSSFVLGGKKADREHPYGHGRYEYVAGLIVSIIIIMVGAELVKSSIERIVSGERSEFSLAALIVLIASVAVKAVMAVMYFIRNKSVKSDTLKAACFDSASDCVVTLFVGVAFVCSPYTDFPLDAVFGIIAAVFIVFGGVKIVLSTLDKLLGERPDGVFEKNIEQLVLSFPSVLGVHDLMVHDYGEEHKVASVDAEFDKNMSFVEVHDIVSAIERAAYRDLNVHLVVHSDPVDKSNRRYNRVRRAVVKALEPYGMDASFHELHISDEDKTARLHLRLSEKLMRERDHILAEVMESVKAQLDGYTVEAEYDFM